MAAATSQEFLQGAVVLELQDVGPKVAADYLTRVQRHPAPAGWGELTDRLRHAPGSPIARALSLPLTLTLVRDTYRGGDDVGELLDFCDADGQGTSRESIEARCAAHRRTHLPVPARPAAGPPRRAGRAQMSQLPGSRRHLARAGTRDRAAKAMRAVLAVMAPAITHVMGALDSVTPVISTASSVAMPMHPAIPARAASR